MAMVRIDAHAHIFPDRIAAKASEGIGRFYDIPTHHDGSLTGLLEEEGLAGVSRVVAHSVATTPAQVDHINEFILSVRDRYPDRIIPFAALHPDTPDMENAVKGIVAAGFRGVKLHPDFQEFAVDEPRALRMFSLLAGKLPVLLHTGDYRYDYSNPNRVAHLLDELPELTAICAHLAGWSVYEEARKLLAGRRIYVDTSSSLYRLKPDYAAELIRAFGVDRAFFGTDYPMWTPKEEVDRLEALPLTASEKERIFHANVEALLG
ncbi:MAG: amidohydrolase family protein [Clostridiales bacterium]|nr:amidohydrolase family protein [Clostridiales bacterium]